MKDDEFDSLVEATLEENENGMGLFKALNELKILKNIFLKPRHETLIPALILHLKKIERIKEKKLKMKTFAKENSKYKISPLIKKPKMTLKEAYTKLTNLEEPETEVEKLIDEYMEVTLRPYFKPAQAEMSGGRSKPPKICKNGREGDNSQPKKDFLDFISNANFEEKSQTQQLNQGRRTIGLPKILFQRGARSRANRPKDSKKGNRDLIKYKEKERLLRQQERKF